MALEWDIRKDPEGDEGDLIVKLSRDGQKVAHFDLTAKERDELVGALRNPKQAEGRPEQNQQAGQRRDQDQKEQSGAHEPEKP